MSAALSCAVKELSPLKVVGRSSPLNRTREETAKFTPRTCNGIEPPPATSACGESRLIAGSGFVADMLNDVAFDTPPAGSGLKTVTFAFPAVCKSEAGISAASKTGLTKVVGRLLPFHCTTDPLTNPPPFTRSVKTVPMAALFGEIEEIVGSGLGCFIAIVIGLETPPPGVGLKTVTAAVPGAPRSEAGIIAVSCVLLM